MTARLLAERGQAGARLVDIAEAASVTPAAVSYYYPDLADLYADTYETAAEEYLTRRRERVGRIADPVERLVACITLGVPQLDASSREATILLMELSALATRHERIVSSGRDFEAEQLGLYEEILEAGVAAGVMRPTYGVPETARAILAVEDGIAIPVVAGRLAADEALRVTLTVAESLVGTELRGAGAR